MTGNLTTTKKIAGVVGACAVLLGGVACTQTVDGTASAAPIAATSDSPSPKSSSKSSSKSSTSSSSSPPSPSSPSGGGGTAQAPDEPYSYTDGTTVKLDSAVEKNDISGLLSSEVGRVLPFHIDNKSQWTLDLSSTATLADVDCEGSSEYVFPSEPIGGPEQLPPGQAGDYNLYVGVKKDNIGKTCTIVIPFDAAGASSVDEATFSMVIN